MVRAEDLAKSKALLEAFDSAETVAVEATEADPNDRSLQQFRARTKERDNED